MTDDLHKTACRIKWPSGRETICRCQVLVDAAAATKRVIDVLGGRVLVVVDLEFVPQGYRSCSGIEKESGVGAGGIETPAGGAATHKRVPVPLETKPGLPSAQNDLFGGRALEGDPINDKDKTS